ncbi:hypothetical protein NDU88_006446 [Pleurodeles waltl]|uniref:Uncharacterized protein n=1 Tax=Pleurodeles waltl TaxID=8319 RepID=A0AAV7NQ82_PLEWA|nr:hypothetical protein NDU88_006446 [Pleurodeles waltl]
MAPQRTSVSAAPGALQVPTGKARVSSVQRGSREHGAQRGGRSHRLRCSAVSAAAARGSRRHQAPPASLSFGQLRPGQRNLRNGPPPKQSLPECRPSCRWLAPPPRHNNALLAIIADLH